MDGGTVSAPEFAFYEPKTGVWIAENKGVTPDIEVDRRPDMVAQGRDVQLEKAVEVLMAELKKQKPKAVKREDFPKVKKGGG
jgi:tricorn protease